MKDTPGAGAPNRLPVGAGAVKHQIHLGVQRKQDIVIKRDFLPGAPKRPPVAGAGAPKAGAGAG